MSVIGDIKAIREDKKKRGTSVGSVLSASETNKINKQVLSKANMPKARKTKLYARAKHSNKLAETVRNTKDPKKRTKLGVDNFKRSMRSRLN